MLVKIIGSIVIPFCLGCIVILRVKSEFCKNTNKKSILTNCDFKEEKNIISKIECGKTLDEVCNENILKIMNLIKREIIGDCRSVEKEYRTLKIHLEYKDNYGFYVVIEKYYKHLEESRQDNKTYISYSSNDNNIKLIQWAISHNFKTTTKEVLNNYNN